MRRAGATALTVAVLAGALTSQALVAGAGATTGSASATAPTAAAGGAPALTGASSGRLPSDAEARFPIRARFAREVARRGDQDASVRRIEHVGELQYRLRWADVYNGPVTGYFGDRTKAAVKRFQRRIGIKRTGVAHHSTWRPLIKRTVRHEKALPRKCTRGRGWHVCYDRRYHQLTVWRRGKLWNSWLVRGGARGYQTRTGNFHVFWRDRDHVSGLYGSPMPYSQFFSGGQAFHGSTYMMDPFSGHSHGCVNMYIEDARQLWRVTSDARRINVHVYGHWS